MSPSVSREECPFPQEPATCAQPYSRQSCSSCLSGHCPAHHTLFLGFKGLGPELSPGLSVTRRDQRIQNQQVTHSVSHALSTQCPFIPPVGKPEVFASWDSLLRASRLLWHIQGTQKWECLVLTQGARPFALSLIVRSLFPRPGLGSFTLSSGGFSCSPLERQRGSPEDLSHLWEE